MRTHSLVIATALSLVAGPALAQARTLTVDDAIALALQANPHLQARQSNARAARELEKSARGRMLPRLAFFDEGQHWNSAFAIPFSLSPGTPPFDFNVRNQNVNSLTVSADQPLVGLLHLSDEKTAQGLAADASEADLEAARADVKEAVQVGFLGLFEAKALEDIARASESELAEQVQVTKARVAAGVLTNADALRVQVAVANAKQQEILAHTQGEVARARLMGTLGLAQGEQGVDFAEPKTLLAQGRSNLPRLQDAQQQAVATRPELRQLKLQIDALDHAHRARKFALLPEVDAEAAYNRLDGEILAPTNAEFVGFKVNWNFWEWGTSWYQMKASEAQADAARHELENEGQQVGVEVASDLAQAHAATAAVDVAQDTIASAEEAYRVTQALLKAGSATTTDLLDAQAALTQARLNLTRAEYEQAIARVTLARGIGK